METLVHLEHMIGRSEHHVATAFLVGENHRLEHVHHLGYVGHAHAVGVLVEDVEHERGHHGIAHAVLLVEVAGYGAGLLVPPCAPFVNHQRDLLLWVGLVHDGAMLAHHIVHVEALVECEIVLLGSEDGGLAFVIPVLHRVVVHGNGVHLLANALHERACPVVVVVRGA